MATPLQSPRPFNGLSGLELKKAILADIENQLNGDYHFRAHLSYPLVTWRFKLAVNAYPSEIGEFESNAGATLHPKGSREIEEGEEPTQIDIAGGRDVTAGATPSGQTADSVRRDTGQAVSTMKQIKVGDERVMVEAAEIPKPQTQLQEENAKTQQNVPSGKGIVARRATAKTRANPGGVEVAPAAGTAPGPEEAAQIAERISRENQE